MGGENWGPAGRRRQAEGAGECTWVLCGMDTGRVESDGEDLSGHADPGGLAGTSAFALLPIPALCLCCSHLQWDGSNGDSGV